MESLISFLEKKEQSKSDYFGYKGSTKTTGNDLLSIKNNPTKSLIAKKILKV